MPWLTFIHIKRDKIMLFDKSQNPNAKSQITRGTNQMTRSDMYICASWNLVL